MTTPDPSRVAFQKTWRADDRPETCFASGWQAAMAHKGADCWQPIETAPRGGSVFLALGALPPSGQPWHYECMWNGFEWYHGFGDAWPEAKPTHWQPLSAAPKQEGCTR